MAARPSPSPQALNPARVAQPARRTRAVAPEDKSERRAAILRAADDLLRTAGPGELSVENIAHRAGLAKGTVYLYFGTREEILLAVHGERTEQMFATLDRALDQGLTGGRALARRVVGFLAEHPEFMPLAARCRAMLETNVGVEAAVSYKLGIGNRLAGLGARLEAARPELARGAGAQLLMNSYALMLGLWQLADPPACLAAALDRPEMKVFRIDYERQLTQALIALWDGAAPTPGKASRPPRKSRTSRTSGQRTARTRSPR